MSPSGRWPKDHNQAMTVLVRSFPALRHADGVEPWDAERFYVSILLMSHGARSAGHFVLQVWNCRTDWDKEMRAIFKERGVKPPRGKLGAARFDLLDAMTCWDDEQRAAFITWVREPFWP